MDARVLTECRSGRPTQEECRGVQTPAPGQHSASLLTVETHGLSDRVLQVLLFIAAAGVRDDQVDCDAVFTQNDYVSMLPSRRAVGRSTASFSAFRQAIQKTRDYLRTACGWQAQRSTAS